VSGAGAQTSRLTRRYEANVLQLSTLPS
jgi:hypothetical protein